MKDQIFFNNNQVMFYRFLLVFSALCVLGMVSLAQAEKSSPDDNLEIGLEFPEKPSSGEKGDQDSEWENEEEPSDSNNPTSVCERSEASKYDFSIRDLLKYTSPFLEIYMRPPRA